MENTTNNFMYGMIAGAVVAGIAFFSINHFNSASSKQILEERRIIHDAKIANWIHEDVQFLKCSALEQKLGKMSPEKRKTILSETTSIAIYDCDGYFEFIDALENEKSK